MIRQASKGQFSTFARLPPSSASRRQCADKLLFGQDPAVAALDLGNLMKILLCGVQHGVALRCLFVGPTAGLKDGHEPENYHGICNARQLGG